MQSHNSARQETNGWPICLHQEGDEHQNCTSSPYCVFCEVMDRGFICARPPLYAGLLLKFIQWKEKSPSVEGEKENPTLADYFWGLGAFQKANYSPLIAAIGPGNTNILLQETEISDSLLTAAHWPPGLQFCTSCILSTQHCCRQFLLIHPRPYRSTSTSHTVKFICRFRVNPKGMAGDLYGDCSFSQTLYEQCAGATWDCVGVLQNSTANLLQWHFILTKV